MTVTASRLFWLLAAGALLTAGWARAIETEPSDLDPAIIAKIAKDKAKRYGGGGNESSSGGGTDVISDGTNGKSGCGNVDIGTVNSAPGAGFRAPREVTVIVTGDVVNAGNNCKK